MPMACPTVDRWFPICSAFTFVLVFILRFICLISFYILRLFLSIFYFPRTCNVLPHFATASLLYTSHFLPLFGVFPLLLLPYLLLFLLSSFLVMLSFLASSNTSQCKDQLLKISSSRIRNNRRRRRRRR